MSTRHNLYSRYNTVGFSLFNRSRNFSNQNAFVPFQESVLRRTNKKNTQNYNIPEVPVYFKAHR